DSKHIHAQLVHRRSFRAWFKRAPVPAAVDNRDVAPYVLRFYRARHWEPAWTGARGANGDARELADVLRHAADEGLDPAQYQSPAIDQALERLKGSWMAPKATPAKLGDLDLLLTRSLFKYAIHVDAGQVDPRMLPAEWHIHPRAFDAPALGRAVAGHRVARQLAALAPAAPGYAALRKSLADHRRI